jgi:hypothetical protein
MAALPAVRELTAELASANIDALLINIHDDVGRVLTRRFDFAFSPTYLVFARDGQEVLRANTLPTADSIRLAISFNSSS